MFPRRSSRCFIKIDHGNGDEKCGTGEHGGKKIVTLGEKAGELALGGDPHVSRWYDDCEEGSHEAPLQVSAE